MFYSVSTKRLAAWQAPGRVALLTRRTSAGQAAAVPTDSRPPSGSGIHSRAQSARRSVETGWQETRRWPPESGGGPGVSRAARTFEVSRLQPAFPWNERGNSFPLSPCAAAEPRRFSAVAAGLPARLVAGARAHYHARGMDRARPAP